MDAIAWNSSRGPVISRHDNVYTYVLRCIACGYFRAVHVWQKDDITEELRDVITEIRTDPRFKCSEYVLMTELHLDLAGEQSDVNQEFQSMLKDVGVIPYYSSPHDKRSAAHAENAVKIIEMRAKCIMMERMRPL